MRRFILFVFIVCLSSGIASSQNKDPFSVIKDLSQFTAIPTIPDLLVPFDIGIQNNVILKVEGSNICSCNAGCNVLPVSLLEFDANRISKAQVYLQWKTEHEINNVGFEIQRSLGNNQHFEAVGFVAAQTGTSTQKKYSHTDPNNYSGISYYRLQQIDIDGNRSYSEIVPVKGYGEKANLSVFPNPAYSMLQGEVYFPEMTAATLELYDAGQRKILSQKMNLTAGSNTIKLPLNSLAGGVYFIKIFTHNGETLSGKFIKMN